MSNTYKLPDLCPDCGVPPGISHIEGCNAECYSGCVADGCTCGVESHEIVELICEGKPSHTQGSDDAHVEPTSVEEAASRGLVSIQYVIDYGWLHTHGLDRAGLPELEMMDVPIYLAGPASDLLRAVADYMLENGVRFGAGETMAVSPLTSIRFAEPEPLPGEEDHYEVERLLIVGAEPTCEGCGAGSSG
jgi:hypothetical protein